MRYILPSLLATAVIALSACSLDNVAQLEVTDQANRIANWYVIRNDAGILEAVYGTSDESLAPNSVTTDIGLDNKVVKLPPAELRSHLIWAPAVDFTTIDNVTTARLNQLVENTLEAACDNHASARGGQVSATTEVASDFGGAIRLSILVDTANVCAR